MSYPPQQGPYGQYGQPYPYGPYGQPPKRRTGLIVGLVVGGVLLLVGVLVLVLVLVNSEDEPSGDPRRVAQSWADAVTKHDPKAIVAVSCSLSPADGEYAARELAEQGTSAKLGPEPGDERSGDYSFWVDVARTKPKSYEDPQTRYRLRVSDHGDRWCASIGAGGLPT